MSIPALLLDRHKLDFDRFTERKGVLAVTLLDQAA